MIVAITGSTGLVGTTLVESLEAAGHVVQRLVRGEVREPEREIHWNPRAGQIDAGRLEGVDAVVHLAGENVAGGRWSEKRKARIRDSRLQGTRLLAETLAGLSAKPKVLCSASAVGYYGDRGEELLDESSPPGHGFLAETCREWEAATDPARDAGIRTVVIRIGVVLSPKGGALAKMLLPFKLGLGGVVGSGRQYVSWIALDDLAGVIQFALKHESLSGPVNAVAPTPVTNHELTKTLGRVLRRPTVFPMPAFAARLALGEMADEILLSSARVEPRVLSAERYPFKFSQLEPALRYLLA